MKLYQYQKLAILTMVDKGWEENIIHCFMGLATEFGEILDLFKRERFYGKPVDRSKLGEELGDMMWYYGVLTELLGLELPDEELIPSEVVYTDYEILSKLCVHATRGCSLMCDFSIAEGFIPEIARRCLFWTKMLANNYNFKLEYLAEVNIAKLKVRYPDGRFSKHDAVNRDLNKENQVLTQGLV